MIRPFDGKGYFVRLLCLPISASLVKWIIYWKEPHSSLIISYTTIFFFLRFPGIVFNVRVSVCLPWCFVCHELPSEVNLWKVSHRVLFLRDSRACWIPVPRISVDAAFLLVSCECLMLCYLVRGNPWKTVCEKIVQWYWHVRRYTKRDFWHYI